MTDINYWRQIKNMRPNKSRESNPLLELLPCPKCGREVVMSLPTRQVLGHLTLDHTETTDQLPETTQQREDYELEVLLKGVWNADERAQIKKWYEIRKQGERAYIRETLGLNRHKDKPNAEPPQTARELVDYRNGQIETRINDALDEVTGEK